jgi:NAD(P)H-hydrate epimerase
VENKGGMVADGQIHEGYKMNKRPETIVLVNTVGSRQLDGEASAQWGLNPHALVEAAGRACAQTFVHNNDQGFNSFTVLAGKGNNAADALVMLKALILNNYIEASACSVYAVQMPDYKASPLSDVILALKKIGVPVLAWGDGAPVALSKTDIVIDGITGTGLAGPLRGIALEMIETVNVLSCGKIRPFVVSIDLPSGIFDGWQPGMPIIAAHATLAIEPQKSCLYTPAARPCAGTIIPVRGIFPPALIEKYGEARLVEWNSSAACIPQIPKTAYKYERGLVEMRAGSPGATGAACLAALGAQSAGAGLVRLIVDPSLYPVIAPSLSGVMVVPDGDAVNERFSPNAVLLGPGWGRGDDRVHLLHYYLTHEERGIPLILDADAIILAKNFIFHGNALLTPHPGEFAEYSGLPKNEILANPIPALRRFAAEKKVHILFKSHVLYVASPEGQIDIIDGMNPLLAAGGTGDVLAGFCAAIAARLRAASQSTCGNPSGDSDSHLLRRSACAAASLLVQAGESESVAGRFIDPCELAYAATSIAGAAWLQVSI